MTVLLENILQAFQCLIIAQGPGGALPFSPVKLLLLIVLAYIWFYSIQFIGFSSHLPVKYRTVSIIAAIVAGPLFLPILLIYDISLKSSSSGVTFLTIVKVQIKKLIGKINFSGIRPGGAKESKIILFDSTGKDLKEIYGHSDSIKGERHILSLTEEIVSKAIQQRASDILIDPKDELIYTIRHRVDGVLRIDQELKADICRAVINSIKAVSGMDISEKRRPLDGAFMARQADETISFRAASAGVLHGEKLSIRILNQNASKFTLVDVGFAQNHISIIDDQIKKPSGMILICGPTGSGKTTTLYAMLNRIDRHTRNVITVEDPIEAVLPQSSQIEINPKADITFAKSLRSILRQDPDVICVGEIRDEETAEIALRASQTGHLVFATIHCDGNEMAIFRLMDLGISQMLLSSGLSALISQRLLRKLCEHCKKPARLTDGLIEEFIRKGINYSRIYEPAGCRRCNGTGYFGRTAICDIMVVDDKVKADLASDSALVNQAKSGKTTETRKNLRKEGLRLVSEGLINLQELKRVIG
jgi:general secretion pathway protein E